MFLNSQNQICLQKNEICGVNNLPQKLQCNTLNNLLKNKNENIIVITVIMINGEYLRYSQYIKQVFPFEFKYSKVPSQYIS